jgi:hypothetical protein
MSLLSSLLHCLGSVAAASKKGKGSRGNFNRLTEEEEDAQLLKSAQSKRRVVRVDKQPSILSSRCHMHPYQLEGLNWMIKLHDHGINGILADEVSGYFVKNRLHLIDYLILIPPPALCRWVWVRRYRQFHC